MLNDSFYEIAVNNAAKSTKTAGAQRTLIDALTEEAPILQTMPMEEASHEYHHVFETLVSATTPDIVDLDAPLPFINSETQLGQVHLSKIGGRIFAPQDRAKAMGGLVAYLNKKIPPSLKKSGMEFEYDLYYNRFLAAAIRHKNCISATPGATGDTGYSSIIAITWSPGEMSGLYSPLAYGDGKVFNLEMLYGGDLCEDNQGVQGYKGYVQTMLGVLLENKKLIGAIVNIKDTLPPSRQIGDLLDSVRANGSTRLYCHRRMMRWVGDEYGKQVSRHEFVMLDRKLTTLSFNEVPFVSTFNTQFGTEGAIPVSQ